MNHDTAISRPTGDSTQSTRSTLRRHFDVAVIGYGPVGATLAGLLGRAGLTVGVFDKAGAIYPQPRAVGFDHDAMRLFRRMGAPSTLAPHIADFLDSCYYGADGQLLRKVARLPPRRKRSRRSHPNFAPATRSSRSRCTTSRSHTTCAAT